MLYQLQHNGGQIDSEEISAYMETLIDLKVHMNTDYPWDDIGTATLIGDIYKNSIKYCPQNGNWYVWNFCWEKQGNDNVIYDHMRTVLDLLLLYCKEVEYTDPDDEVIKEYHKYVKGIRKFHAMRSILKLLTTANIINLYEMDTNPYVFNTPGYAYDLRTGEVIEDIRPYNVTKKTSCNLPDFTTKICDRWYQFIDEIMEGDKEKIDFLQKALGYSILGVNKEECMFIAYGSTTRNGKGTLFSSITNALGSTYAGTAPTELICEKSYGKSVDLNSPQPVLARLVGTRFVSMAESGKDVRLDSANMKTMTGRDELVTRDLYESAFSFTPQFTLWLNTNHLPAVTDDTVFSSDRIWVIEFGKHFDSQSQDKNLKDLFGEKDAKKTILKWLFDGCRKYLEEGLTPPKVVITATENYRKTHDRIGCFIEECCQISDENKALRGEIYQHYRSWCNKEENRYKPLGSTTFYNELSVRGYPVVRRNDGYYITGLKMNETAPGRIKL